MVDAEAQTVATEGGETLDYDFLVVAPGLILDHDAIEGFSLDMVGENGIGALYAGPELRRAHVAGGQPLHRGGRARHLHPTRDRDEMRRRAAQAHLPDRRPAAPGRATAGMPRIDYAAPQGPRSSACPSWPRRCACCSASAGSNYALMGAR
jgi:sulfide:quinone oxidoreductase